MPIFANPIQWILGILLILSSLGVISSRKPLYASLSFLLTLLVLAAIYSELSAEFIAVMQILVYAGAILVIFVFVIVLFQDAHEQIENYTSKTHPLLIGIAISFFLVVLMVFATRFIDHVPVKAELISDFGSVHGLGKVLYIDFCFPFEAVALIFLVAIVGALYIAKKEK